MATPSTKLVYCAAAANRSSNVSDVGADGLVAFGSGRLVALWKSEDPDSVGVHQTLPGHLGEVTVLKFVKGTTHTFISGDATGQAIVWRQTGVKWQVIAKLTSHNQSVSGLAAIKLTNDKSLVVTAGSDGQLHASVIGRDGADLVQTFDLKGKIGLEMALSFLPQSDSLVLAVGMTDVKISIFSTSTTPNINFTRSLLLEGHVDWVRSLDFTTPIPTDSSQPDLGYDINPGELLLASGSQDNYIRLWRFARLPNSTAPATASASDPSTSTARPKTGLDSLDELEQTLASIDDDGELRVKAHDFTVEGDGEFSVSAEAVLLGHDTWVTGLHWAPPPNPGAPAPLQLLSASADRSMILWAPDSFATGHAAAGAASSAIWTTVHRFGEFSSATNLGFFGALWGTGGRTVLAHGWGGSWHVWRCGEGGSEWDSVVGVCGHFGQVREVKWEPKGRYLLSCGLDMSTRLHAKWRRQGRDGRQVQTWHELGRPQIHGYPIVSIAFTDRLQFVSGADEKIVRVFDAPKVVVGGLKTLAGVDDLGDENERPMAAMVPPLGLSNRTIANEVEADSLQPDTNDPFAALPTLPANFDLNRHPPLEEQLLGSTLWPETDKLYGHSFELIAIAAAHVTPLIATACKASSLEHAGIRFYSSRTWKPVGAVLAGHALTITRVRFSRSDEWVVSVSRDRTWRVWGRREGGGEGEFEARGVGKGHARIVWDVCWAGDDAFFATASRDKTAKVWAPTGTDKWECAATLKFDEAATAVAATLIQAKSLHLLAVGLENGKVHLFTSPVGGAAEWTAWAVLGTDVAHVLSVTSLEFCPQAEEGEGVVRLASGSEDRSVRVFELSA